MKRLRALVEDTIAGDPINGLRWTHKSTRKLAKALRRQGFQVSANTVGRLLKTQKFSLRTNRKRLARTHEPERDRQFRHIAYLRRRCENQGNPALSIDTKNKELVGLFKNPGKTWRRHPQDVWDHDFPSLASGRAIPFGIYDRQWNSGFVVVGTSHETADFGGEALNIWWHEQGAWRYPRATRWFLEADCGGANSARTWGWKWALQQMADRSGMAITVAHYPPGASKWNPIEHRLFSQISANWQGEPLRDYQTVLKYITNTRNDGGLTCRAILNTIHYPTKVKVTEEQKQSIRIKRSRLLPQWNYTIYPRDKRPTYF